MTENKFKLFGELKRQEEFNYVLLPYGKIWFSKCSSTMGELIRPIPENKANGSKKITKIKFNYNDIVEVE